MISEFGRYYPEVLEPAAKTSKIDIRRNLYGKPLNSFTDIHETLSSLQKFEDIANKGDYLSDLFLDCAKEGVVLPDGKFFIRSYHLEIDHQAETDKKDPGISYFRMDGDYAFSLGFKRKSDIVWLASTSFFLNPDLKGSLTIVQLQGRSYTDKREAEYSKKKKEAIAILEKFRWEFFLLFICADWARTIRLPIVYLQTAEQNEYARRSKSLKDDDKTLKMAKAKQRYNGTARGLRLKIDPKTGMYVIPLECPERVY
ncbi:MAG: hypothetical protein Q8P10_01430 [bacterium]|nr:hypothetical protein [bacterium]